MRRWLALSLVLGLATSCGGGGHEPPPGTVQGTITLPYSVTQKCYVVVVDTSSTGTGIVALGTGVANGTSASYSIGGVPPGTYYVYAGVDNDGSTATPPACQPGSTASIAPTTGDFVGYYGGTSLPPSSSNVVVTAGGTTTASFSLVVYY